MPILKIHSYGSSESHPTTSHDSFLVKPNISIFGTGFGATNPAVPAGSVYSSAAPTTRTVTIQIAGIDCPVAFAGLTGAGLYQMNVTIPATVPNGDQPIVASINGQRTQTGALITILKP